MLIACWSPKGGSGTTVVTAALGVLLAAESPHGATVADLDGDLPAALGLPEPSGPTLADWLAAGPDVPDDALARVESDAGGGLWLLPWAPGQAGSEVAFSDRGEALATALAAHHRPVVADCGRATHGAATAVAMGASMSLLVIRPCYLALRRAVAAPFRPSGVVLVSEDGRSLGRRDVEEVLGVPVRAVVELDPAVARAVDAGLLGRRLPRRLSRALRGAA